MISLLEALVSSSLSHGVILSVIAVMHLQYVMHKQQGLTYNRRMWWAECETAPNFRFFQCDFAELPIERWNLETRFVPSSTTARGAVSDRSLPSPGAPSYLP